MDNLPTKQQTNQPMTNQTTNRPNNQTTTDQQRDMVENITSSAESIEEQPYRPQELFSQSSKIPSNQLIFRSIPEWRDGIFKCVFLSPNWEFTLRTNTCRIIWDSRPYFILFLPTCAFKDKWQPAQEEI